MKKTLILAACMMLCALVFAGCGSSGSGFSTDISKELTHERSAEITAATGFSIDYYNDPSYGAYSENWIWEEEMVTALYEYIFNAD